MDKTEIIYKKVSTPDELIALSKLATRIWNVHYPPIIGQLQVEYMLGKMYSLVSLTAQINSGHEFIAGYEGDRMVGFLSYSKTAEEEFMIHKWYVDTSLHGKGIGRGLFDAAFADVDYKEIRLTVNRQNIQAINFYFKFGFIIEKIADFDIGSGFVMNDFVMLLIRGNK
jgi:ribosomal protein S18 acetylase RimI-like enzyme